MTWHLPDAGCPLDTDVEKLQIVLHNLLDNALSYTDAGGEVECHVSRDVSGTVNLELRNTGCKIGPKDAPNVFDRFWRGDGARAGSGPHSGLGLSLCRRLVTLLGGELTASAVLGGHFTIRLSLPSPSNGRPWGRAIDIHVPEATL